MSGDVMEMLHENLRRAIAAGVFGDAVNDPLPNVLTALLDECASLSAQLKAADELIDLARRIEEEYYCETSEGYRLNAEWSKAIADYDAKRVPSKP